MANTIQQKRSLTPDAVPTTAELTPGEFAVQAADGKVFIKTTENTVINLLDYTIADGGEITAAGIQAPAHLTATSYEQAVELSWTTPVSNTYPIVDYIVQYSTAPQSNSWTTFSAGIRTVIPVYNLTAGVNYKFRVAAVNSAGQGPWSSLVSATPFSFVRGVVGTPSPGYGGLIRQDGDYFVHKFLQSGTLNNTGNNLSYLIVGAGGGGGGGGGAGGGGGGQVILGTIPNDGTGQYVFFTNSTYAVTIGDGGTPGGDGTYAAAGTNSSLELHVRGTETVTQLVARGGGGGGQYDNRPGGNGASGGGGTNASTGSLGGAAITPGVTGYNGQAGSLNGGGGGGGAGGPGTANIGGVGITTSITGAAVTYGSGGNGSNATLGATNGRANSGNGGSGGGSAQQGGYGGSGVVIIRYIPVVAVY
jgi:hypothetical protein